LLWEYAATPTRGLLVATGVSLGLTLACKFSAIGIVAGLGVAGAVFVLRGGMLALPSKPQARGIGSAVELALRMGAIATVVVAATYAFIQFPEWGKGLKFQLTRGTHGDGVLYLNGEVSRRGWYYYFVEAVALKAPLGLLLAATASAVCAIKRRAISRRAVLLAVPSLVFFALATYSRVNVGVRAVLPVLPFVYLLASGLAGAGCCRIARRGVCVACVAWCAFAAERASPHEIAYFNEIAGGPAGGAKYLADSNLDWGQGLPELKAWMDREAVDAVYLGFFGTDRPEAYGIRYQPLPGYGRVGKPGGQPIDVDAPRQVVAVSVNHLLGMFLNEADTYSWLRDRKPMAIIGGCIYIFDLTGDPAAIARVRAIAPR
jgi:hypothetical protein